MSGHSGLAPEQKVGSYVLIQRLGAGGIGEVWKARDQRLNRVVALKFISAERRGASPARELLREARAASVLNHPNIVTVFEVGEAEGGTYLAMEFVEGETLRERMRRPPVPLDEALDIAMQVVSALAAAHRNGIVHRDLKPENIMLRADGYVKLVDFGLAKVLPWAQAEDEPTSDSQGTEPGQLVGTFTYMSPEQARGRAATPASDIFGFGIVLYELLSGEHPFRGETSMDTLNAILSREPAPLSTRCAEVSAAIAEVTARALQKEPSQRYASGVELRENLERARSERAAPAAAAAPVVRSKPRWMQALGGVLIVALLGFGAWSMRPHESGGQRGGAMGLVQVQSVAVMNFRPAADDAAAGLVASSLPDDLGVALASAGFQVAPRSGLAAASGTTDARSLGVQLGVDAVLAGSVRSYGGRFRVYVELVSTRTGFQVWSGTFTVEAGDLLESGPKIAHEIAAQIRGALRSK